MSKRNIAKFIRCTIFALIVLFSLFSLLFLLSYAPFAANSISAISPTFGQTMLLAGGVLLALPCLLILFLAIPFVNAVEKENVFRSETAKRLCLIARILLWDSILFLFSVLLLFFLGEQLVTPLLGILAIVGIALGIFLRILSDYIRDAALLQEEVEATL